MSNSDFVKGECRLCGGHLEFPATATGQTIPCPHCGKSIALVAGSQKNGGSRRRVAVIAGALCCVAAAGAVLISHHTEPPPLAVPASVPTVAITRTNVPAAVTVTNPPVEQLRPGEVATNHFAISGGTVQTTSGSSLVYVVGTVRNTTDHQRFGVKVDYALFDTNDVLIGHASDYESVIEANGAWNFKALVMESKKFAAAKFSGITEQ